MIEKLKKHSDKLYFLFRVLVGFLFFQHGAQKLFGWFSSKGAVQLVSLMGLAGVIEFAVGILVLLGLFTRIASVFGAITMFVAYFMVHASKAIAPLANGGELAVLYFAAFLVLIINGSKKWALESKILKTK